MSKVPLYAPASRFADEGRCAPAADVRRRGMSTMNLKAPASRFADEGAAHDRLMSGGAA